MADGRLYVELTALKRVNMGYRRNGKATEPRWVAWYTLHFDNEDMENQVEFWMEDTQLFDNAGHERDWYALSTNDRTELGSPIMAWLKRDGIWKIGEVDKAPAISQTELLSVPDTNDYQWHESALPRTRKRP